MNNPNLLPYRIDRSPIHEHGIFAIRFIRKGEVVPMPGRRSGFAITICDDPRFGGFNHACHNNLSRHADVYGNLREDGHFRMALSDIMPGEELTVRYSHFPDGSMGFVCRCERCREGR